MKDGMFTIEFEGHSLRRRVSDFLFDKTLRGAVEETLCNGASKTYCIEAKTSTETKRYRVTEKTVVQLEELP